MWVDDLKRYGTVIKFGTSDKDDYLIDAIGMALRRKRILLAPVKQRFLTKDILLTGREPLINYDVGKSGLIFTCY